MSDAGHIDWSDPVVRDHPLLRDCRSWWLVGESPYFGGVVWRDLMPRCKGFGGNNGSFVGNATWTTARGRPGGLGAILFDGSGDYVDTAEVSIPNGLTYTAWVNTTTLTGDHAIVSNRSTLFTMNGGNLQWWYSIFIGNRSVAHSFSANRWYHVAVTNDLSGNYAIYRDGNSIASGGSTAYNNTAGASEIGFYTIFGSRYWNGRIDDVRIYDRALPASDIRRVYLDSLHGYPELLRRQSRRTWFVPAVAPALSPAIFRRGGRQYGRVGL